MPRWKCIEIFFMWLCFCITFYFEVTILRTSVSISFAAPIAGMFLDFTSQRSLLVIFFQTPSFHQWLNLLCVTSFRHGKNTWMPTRAPSWRTICNYCTSMNAQAECTQAGAWVSRQIISCKRNLMIGWPATATDCWFFFFFDITLEKV